jgi:hypothetical protein
VSALPAADDRKAAPAHVYLDTPHGHLRITRWPGGHLSRTVFRVMPDGELVALGTITGARHALLAVPALEGLPIRGCETYVAGARALAAMLKVTTRQVYTLAVRTEGDG